MPPWFQLHKTAAALRRFRLSWGLHQQERATALSIDQVFLVMAPAAGDNSLVKTVTEEGEYSWEKCLAASDQKLLVVDCHQDWCGRCETLQPTFQRIALETTESENRCMFLEANLDKFADRVQALLPKDSQTDLTTHGCMPFTVVIKGGAAVASIRGCDAPAILREVTKHMPPPPTSDDKEAEPE